MRYRIGRLLQFAGLVILPQAIVLEVLGRVSLVQSILIAVGGTGLFMLGVSIQRSAER